MIFNKNKGITLIALIITVVILLILAGVSVVALRDTSLFERTQRATQVYNESRLDEEEKLSGYQYAVDEHTAGVATVNKLKNNSYLILTITTENHLTATVTATKAENSDIDLTNFKIMMASGDSDFVPEESDWEEKSSIEVTEPNSMVYAVLFDGTKYGPSTSKLITNSDIDNIKPTINIQLALTEANLGINLQINVDDEGTGIDLNKCKYIINNSSNDIDDDLTKYNTAITNKTTTYTHAKTPGTYWVHVVATDLAGNTYTAKSSNSVTTAVKNYGYTGGAQSTTLVPGEYKLEVWGAQGGGTYGGKGAYISGNKVINTNTTAYTYVGGQGNKSSTSSIGSGGFNGGGYAPAMTSGETTGWGAPSSGGGGATDIRLDGTALSNRIIVAGAGGGGQTNNCTSYYYPASDGRTNSNTGSNTYGYGGYAGGSGDAGHGYWYCCGGPGSGATQSRGGYGGGVWSTARYAGGQGSLGQGGNGSTVTSSTSGCGGGGGYYGGGGGASGCGGSCGGGGSSYYGGVTSATAYAGNQTFTAPNGSSETGHTGHGYARITPIG